MKKLFLLVALSFIACKTAKVNDVENYQVKEADVSVTLQYLASDMLEGRDTGSKGIENAANYLEQLLEEADVQPYFSS